MKIMVYTDRADDLMGVCRFITENIPDGVEEIHVAGNDIVIEMLRMTGLDIVVHEDPISMIKEGGDLLILYTRKPHQIKWMAGTKGIRVIDKGD
jgi:hypothetical protein